MADELLLTSEETYLFESIVSARKLQGFLWGFVNSEWGLKEWRRMFRKRIKKIDDIDPTNPHWKIELKKRLLQNTALGIALLALLDSKELTDGIHKSVPSNLEAYDEAQLAKAKPIIEKAERGRIIASIRSLEQSLVKVEGRLLMADVKENALRCRIHPSSDMPILCSYNESLVPQIMSNLRKFIEARGVASRDPVTNKIRSLVIYDLEPIKGGTIEEILVMPSSAFWEAKSFEELADEQGIYPVDDLSKVSGGFPEDADFESFLASIRSSRDN